MQNCVWKASKQECGTKALHPSLALLGQFSDREVWKGSQPVKTHILSSDVADTAPHGSKYENVFK